MAFNHLIPGGFSHPAVSSLSPYQLSESPYPPAGLSQGKHVVFKSTSTCNMFPDVRAVDLLSDSSAVHRPQLLLPPAGHQGAGGAGPEGGASYCLSSRHGYAGYSDTFGPHNSHANSAINNGLSSQVIKAFNCLKLLNIISNNAQVLVSELAVFVCHMTGLNK